jgi:hypothetical protein
MLPSRFLRFMIHSDLDSNKAIPAKLLYLAARKPRVEIEYCTQSRWLLSAAWIAQELLTTFQDEICELADKPTSRFKSGVVAPSFLWAQLH